LLNFLSTRRGSLQELEEEEPQKMAEQDSVLLSLADLKEAIGGWKGAKKLYKQSLALEMM